MLLDVQVFVKIDTLQKLTKVYRTYCTECIDGFVTLYKQFEWIPSKIICWCYDEDYKDFKYVVHTSWEYPCILLF
jgi:hypothetical protein